MATLEQIAAALQKADAAGNVEDARALANAYRQMQAQGQSAPVNADPGFNPMSDLPIPGTSHPTAPDNRYKPMIPGGAMLNEFAQSFGENIPVVGPLATRVADATGAQIASMITGKPAEKMATQGQEMRARDASDNQVANVAGTVAGSVGPLMSLGTTKVGEQALGIAGPMWQRMFAGATSGGLIAGGDAAARGDDAANVARQTLMGFNMGGVFPLAERAVSPFIRMLTGQNASKATQSISNNLERAGIDPANLPSLMDDLGPDAMMLDLNKNLTRQGGGIASLPGEGSTHLDDVLTARHAGTNARIKGDVDDILGEAPIPSRLAAEIDANRKALSPHYEQALDGASAVDTSGVALSLDSMIVNERGAAQTAAGQVRKMLDVTGTNVLDPNPRTLLNTRHAIDGILFTDGAAAPLDANIKRVLGQIRREIDAELAAKVPGIKDVDARYSELAKQSKGVETGGQVLSSGQNTVIRPVELDDMLRSDATSIVGPSGVPFRISQGTRAEIDRVIGTTGNDVTALKSALKGDGSWNREKLASLYGDDNAAKLIQLLEREQRYADSFNRITQNSETAARTAFQKEAAPHQFGQTSTSLMDLALKIPQGLANAGARSRSEATNKAIAEMLTGKITPELVDQLLSARQMNRGLMGSSAVPLLTN